MIESGSQHFGFITGKFLDDYRSSSFQAADRSSKGVQKILFVSITFLPNIPLFVLLRVCGFDPSVRRSSLRHQATVIQAILLP